MLNDFEKASSIFTEAIQNFNPDDVTMESSRKKIENGLKFCVDKKINDEELSPMVNLSLHYPLAEDNIFTTADRKILAMSDQLHLAVNDADGRGVFASSDINIGD